MYRVLLLTQFFPPETGAAANRIGPMADMLSKHFNLLVVTLMPSYPLPDLYRTFNLKDIDAQKSYAVERTFHFKPHNKELIIRGIRELVMSIRLGIKTLFKPANLILVSSPSMFLVPVGFLLTKLKRAKFACDVRDVTWRYAQESVVSSYTKQIIANALERFMLSILKRADLVISATPGIEHELSRKGVCRDQIITIPNGVINEFFSAFNDCARAVPKIRHTVTYVGLFGYNHGIGIILDIARELPGVDFILVGDGPERQSFQKAAEDENLSNIYFMGYVVDRAKIIEIYKSSDILFNHAKDAPILNNTLIPAKNFEYMATGKPIVYAGKGTAVSFLEKVGCAVTVPPEDPKAVADAIRDLLRNPDKMYSLGQKGRAFIEMHYRRDILTQQLVDEIKRRFI